MANELKGMDSISQAGCRVRTKEDLRKKPRNTTANVSNRNPYSSHLTKKKTKKCQSHNQI